jgi:hypothetical protein
VVCAPVAVAQDGKHSSAPREEAPLARTKAAILAGLVHRFCERHPGPQERPPDPRLSCTYYREWKRRLSPEVSPSCPEHRDRADAPCATRQ